MESRDFDSSLYGLKKLQTNETYRTNNNPLQISIDSNSIGANSRSLARRPKDNKNSP